MKAEELKKQLTINMIKDCIFKMGGVIFYEDEEVIIMNTFCHGGKSANKLYFYKDSKCFHCYTDCGCSFDIIELVCKNKKLKLNDSISWIAKETGISLNKNGFGIKEDSSTIQDWEFINNIRIRYKNKSTKNYNYYNTNILNIFQEIYSSEWIEEGISVDTMRKYNILYSTAQQKIIIPHYDIHNGLLGIRGRAMLEEDVKNGKYTPYYHKETMYNHPLGQYLYGLHLNKNTIQKKRKIMLVESEKSVMQSDTMFGDDNFTVALCGKNLTNFQRDIILSLGVDEVIIGMDKQWSNNEEMEKWAIYIRDKIITKLAPYVVVSVLWDTENLLQTKDSPTDRGIENLLYLMNNKIYVGTKEVIKK